MVTYTQFLDSDVGSYLLSYIHELVEQNNILRDNMDVLKYDTTIFERSVDNILYEVYDTLMNGISEMQEELDEHFEEMQSDIEDGVYQDID